jgi:polyhydroxyalkanoate synthesis regulator phasin
MRDELRRMALFGSGVAELTVNRAEQIARDLMRTSDERRQKMSALVKDLMEVSRDNRKELLRLLRSEVQSQIQGLGVASDRDVARLERRVERLEKNFKKVTERAGAGKKPTAAKATGVKSSGKSTAKKTTKQVRGSEKSE